ncbi:MAG: thiolase C-terminal domain-containing protein [Candidatus Njordarchaeia archaeon]
MTVYVRNAGMIKVKDNWELNVVNLAADAALKALEGIDKKKIDYLVVSNMTSQHLNNYAQLANAVRDALGLEAKPITVENACGSGGYAVNLGYKLVKSGAENVLVVGVEKLTDSVTKDVTTSMMLAEDRFFTFNSGVSFVGLNALALDLYVRRYNVDREDIMLLPVLDHENGSKSPYAQFPYRITLEIVKKSPMIADPLHLLECSGTGDGAAAVLLSSDGGHVKILASQTATDRFRLYERTDPLTFSSTVEAARKAYEEANVTPNDIDVLEIHDAFSITGIISLEDLGFAKKGEAAKLLKEGKLDLNGELPVNTFGGLKSRGHPVGATGVYQVAEIFMQLTEQAGRNQVDGAKIGLAHNFGSVGTSTAITILGKHQ